MVRRVVVGWDGSAAAAAALEWAARHYPEAERVELLQVGEGARRERGGPGRDPDEAAEAFRATHPACDVRVVREDGEVAQVLASRTAPDTILVLGGRGNEEARLGRRTSTAYRVVLDADGPVAVVPQSFRTGRDVVVGVAGRDDDPCVVLTAAREAVARHQRLKAVHARRPLFGVGLGALPGDAVNHDHDLQDVEQMVDEVLEPIAAAHPKLPVSRHVLRGRAADVLLAESRAAALLVIGREDMAHADRRPVTHSSMLLSRAPVIVVPPGTEVS